MEFGKHHREIRVAKVILRPSEREHRATAANHEVPTIAHRHRQVGRQPGAGDVARHIDQVSDLHYISVTANQLQLHASCSRPRHDEVIVDEADTRYRHALERSLPT